MKPVLFLLLGYPGSGKTTFSRQLAEARSMIRVGSDEIRCFMYDTETAIRNTANNPAVFGALDYAAGRVLAAGLAVMYDANLNLLKDRDAKRKLAGQYGAETVVLWVRTPLAVARGREAARPPDKGFGRIPLERYDELAAGLQEPAPDEPVIEIDGLDTFEKQLRKFDEAMKAREGVGA